MSSIKLNLVDSQNTLSGTIHASIGDFCVAALAAEPETLSDLEAALTRFQKEPIDIRSRLSLRTGLMVDFEPYDAGLMIVDLAARIVVCDSTYSQPEPSGMVTYHDSSCASECPIGYQLDPEEWLFLDSIDDFQREHNLRQQIRTLNPPLDARPVLYGRPLVEFIAHQIANVLQEIGDSVVQSVPEQKLKGDPIEPESDAQPNPFSSHISTIHKDWLITPREDLRGQPPREIMLSKQSLIDFDLESRCLQWSLLLEGPPCLDRESYAYRFAGFGIHEWVVYYYLVRFLITQGFEVIKKLDLSQSEVLISKLEELKLQWLAEPNDEFSGHVPFIVLDNERKRLPEAMGGRTMVVDEECPICKMMGDEAEAGLGVFFWHLDGCNMEQDFAFSTHLAQEEWETEQLIYESISKECKEKVAQRERAELIEDEFPFDSIQAMEFVPWRPVEEEPPEA
jgi:hypothetical protein